MEKPVLKSYFGDIFFEYIVHETAADAILYLEGFPSSGSHKREIEFLYKEGYNVFIPHYKGTYQSRGKFLKDDIVYDLKIFVDKLRKGTAINLWDLSKINFKMSKIR